ncbi:SemiSWEET transporter [Aerococcaceae bacterium DSM 111176]|nr:SemiSWEET transporter [Aerococcaceae bacterium DSM 111176]
MLGMIAAILTTTAFVPQAWKIIKTKKTNGLSPVMYMMSTSGMTLWLLHGISKNDFALIGANAISVVLNGIILFYILKYQGKRDPV